MNIRTEQTKLAQEQTEFRLVCSGFRLEQMKLRLLCLKFRLLQTKFRLVCLEFRLLLTKLQMLVTKPCLPLRNGQKRLFSPRLHHFQTVNRRIMAGHAATDLCTALNLLSLYDGQIARAERHDVAVRVCVHAGECFGECARRLEAYMACIFIGELRDELDVEAFGFGEERPSGLTVDGVSVEQTRGERARVGGVEPLQEVCAPCAVGTCGEPDNRAAVCASVRGHVERLVRLN